jgi:uncharacterized integral membrane protein
VTALPEPSQPRERPPGSRLDERQRRQLVTLGLLVVVAILILAFILENRQRVEVSFIVFTARTSLIWLIVLSLFAGAVAGHLAERMVRRRLARRDG